MKNEDVSDEMNALAESGIRKIDFEYRKLIENIRKIADVLCRDALSPNFWQNKAFNVERGSGYYSRLMQTIERQMMRTGLGEDTSTEILKLIDTFFDNVVYVLEN